MPIYLSSTSNNRPPFIRTHILDVSREKPDVPLQIFHRVLPLTVTGLIQLFRNPRAERFCSCMMRVHVFYKHREGLRPAADLHRTCSIRSSALQHDPRVAQMKLSALGRVAITIMLSEPEGPDQPRDGFFDVVIDHMCQQRIDGNRTIVHHSFSLRLSARELLDMMEVLL